MSSMPCGHHWIRLSTNLRPHSTFYNTIQDWQHLFIADLVLNSMNQTNEKCRNSVFTLIKYAVIW
ncbi:hypothetical protein C0J52_10674 [Blattella germanica]|nr:hypothetical protein C0J52_10674 [Blattella germanica]